jgi:protein-S-isoprenylcysteine O-methyltransferase Ste14
MRAGGVLFLGVILNLGVALAPVWLLPFDGGWLGVETLVLGMGLTLLLLGDASLGRTLPRRAEIPADRQAVRWALGTGIALLLIVWLSLLERQLSASQVGAGQVACGAMLLGLGAALRAAAVRQLGSRFVTEVTPLAGDQLTRSGIYQVVRHPSEAGLLLASAGIPILLGSFWTASLALPMFVGLTWRRLVLEESALLTAHGPAYETYRRQVGGLWPKWPRLVSVGQRCLRKAVDQRQ